MSDLDAKVFPDVKEVLPHRAPFLLIEKVIELTDKRVVATCFFGKDEPFFAGHFPNNPIVPGVLLVEGLAQTMAYWALTHSEDKNLFLVGIDHARFRSVVSPNSEVIFTVDVAGERMGLLKGDGRVTVKETLVADATVIGYSGKPSQVI